MNKIIHIDMDCFYAAIEMRDNPSLKEKPLAIGGSIEQRGVLSTCNYVARQYGLHSAMSTFQALQKCPQLVLLPVNMPLYKAVSQQILAIFKDYTDLIEPLSLDEAYLDVTAVDQFYGSATLIAADIRKRIATELNLSASAGIAPLKFLAKIASDYRKPNGMFTIAPEDVEPFILNLPLSQLPGVGKVTTQRLGQLGLFSCKDIRISNQALLIKTFGKIGQRIWNFSHAIDERKINPHRIRKSVGVEKTLLDDIDDLALGQCVLEKLYQKLLVRLHKRLDEKVAIKVKLGLKLKFSDFKQTTQEKTMYELSLANYQQLLTDTWQRRNNKKIRLIGIYVLLPEYANNQLSLFD